MTNPTRYSLTIQGHNPAPQGSKAYAGHRYNAKAGRDLPVLREESKRVGPWRQVVTQKAVAAGARQRLRAPLDGYLEASIVFIMEPTKTALREIAKHPDGARAVFPATRTYGDVDKLQRSTLDGLADAKVIHDDARVIRIHAVKVFPGCFPRLDRPGAYIRLRHLDPAALAL
jgi:Holliday junction resolvase RusA-like endonuclease